MIYKEADDNQLFDMSGKSRWMNNQIRDGLREGQDYMLVTPKVYERLNSRFKSVQEKYQDYKRVGAEQDDGEIVVEMKMRRLQFVSIPNKKLYKMKNPWVLYAPKSLSLEDLRKKVKNALNHYLLTKQKVKDVMVKDFLIWKLNEPDFEYIFTVDLKHWNYTSAEIDGVCLVKQNPDKTMKLDDLNFVDEDILIIENQKQDGSFVFRARGEKKEEVKYERDDDENEEEGGATVDPDAPFIPAVVKVPQLTETVITDLLPAKSAAGLTGLQNLGNTCFMNSGL